jgi:F5/8 type C domain-containing protein
MTRSPRSGAAPWLIALAGYTSLTLVLTWPLARRLATVVPHDVGDPLLNTWTLWWNAHATPLTARWWDAPMFWPMKGSIALSEHLLGLSIVASPLQWLGAEPIAAYNVLFLVSFPLCAMAAHALGHTLTGRHDAAALAGLIFAFNPFKTSHLPHLQIQWAFWMPLALMALHRYASGGGWRWLVLFAAMWIGQALSNGYFQLFFPVLLGLWTVWFLASRSELPRLAAVAAAWLLGSILLLPVAISYLRLHEQLALRRDYQEILQFSADLSALAAVPPLSLTSSLLPPGNAEQQLFPGFTVVALVGLAAVASFARSGRETAARRWAKLLFGGLACVGAGLSLLALFGYPWVLRIGDRTIISVTTAVKPLTTAIWCVIFALAAGGTFARARTARSAFAFYTGAAVAMYVLSFGPQPSFLGATFWYRPPYAWLMELPGFTIVRAPARFGMLAQLCLAAAAALALVRIDSWLPRRLATAVVIVALAGAVADGWIRSLPLAPLPEQFASLESSTGGAAVELPLDNFYDSIAALYRSIYHRRPTVNGYSGFTPVHYAVLREAIEADGMDAFDGITPHGPLTFVDSSGRIVGTRDRRAADPAPAGRSLPIREVTAGYTSLDLAPLTDADGRTRWDSGAPQDGTETITIDLGLVGHVDAVMLAIGAYHADFPRLLAVDVSEDLHAWTTRWSGRCGAKAVAAALEDARLVPLTVSFPATAARYIRLRQLGSDPVFHWSIAELGVFDGSSASRQSVFSRQFLSRQSPVGRRQRNSLVDRRFRGIVESAARGIPDNRD